MTKVLLVAAARMAVVFATALIGQLLNLWVDRLEARLLSDPA